MMRDDSAGRRPAAGVQLAAAMIVALGIFAVDLVSPLQGAIAVLYTTVTLVAARGNASFRFQMSVADDERAAA